VTARACPRCGHNGPDVIYDATGSGLWCSRCRTALNRPVGSAVPALIVLALAGGAAVAWMLHLFGAF